MAGRRGRSGRLLTMDVAVLPAVNASFRLRRRTEARSRSDGRPTAVIVLALGVLVAPSGVTQAGR
ncbi:hypothetical protein BIV23_20565 [Streptomyces monashensis]|uniref:Uncharacterized protein n=1 Tax=Streptomyces monashensis TaxID=1678012 RepID=A0A1S2QE42_9ACTN|nr:hypothetical protein BIV23_20565 [Streptomyces monashensis]